MNKLEALLNLFKDLMNKKYTGQLRLNFHEGNLSEKIEKKESLCIDKNIRIKKLRNKPCYGVGIAGNEES